MHQFLFFLNKLFAFPLPQLQNEITSWRYLVYGWRLLVRGDKMKTIFHGHLTNASDFQYEPALGHLGKCIVFNLVCRN